MGSSRVRQLLGSRVKLPSDYRICKLGYVLPESYLMMVSEEKGLYKLFRDYNTYAKVAADAGEKWIPSGSDVDSLIYGLLNYGYSVNSVNDLSMDKKCDLATRLAYYYGLSPQEVALRLNMSRSTVSQLLYSYAKKH